VRCSGGAKRQRAITWTPSLLVCTTQTTGNVAQVLPRLPLTRFAFLKCCGAGGGNVKVVVAGKWRGNYICG